MEPPPKQSAVKATATNTTLLNGEIKEKKECSIQTFVTFLGDTLYKKMDDDDVKMLPDRFRVEQVCVLLHKIFNLEQANYG